MKKLVFIILGIVFTGLVSCNNDDLEKDLERIETQNEELLAISKTNFKKTKQLKRGEVIGSLLESIARQPATAQQLDSITTKFIGAFDASQLTGDPVIDGQSRGIAISELIEGIARQPEAFEVLTTTATKFLGDFDPVIFSNETIDVARDFTIGRLNFAIARQPEGIDLYNSVTKQFLNFSFLEVEDAEEVVLKI